MKGLSFLVTLLLCLMLMKSSEAAQEMTKETRQVLITLISTNLELMSREIDKTRARIQSLESKVGDLRRENENLQRLTRETFPLGVILLFEKCPAGWTLYTAAGGRFVIGAGAHRNVDETTELLEILQPGEEGGKKRTILTEAQLPRHAHASGFALSGRPLPWGPGTHPIPTKASRKGSEFDWSVGKGGPFTNIPPYVALSFCRKNTESAQ